MKLGKGALIGSTFFQAPSRRGRLRVLYAKLRHRSRTLSASWQVAPCRHFRGFMYTGGDGQGGILAVTDLRITFAAGVMRACARRYCLPCRALCRAPTPRSAHPPWPDTTRAPSLLAACSAHGCLCRDSGGAGQGCQRCRVPARPPSRVMRRVDLRQTHRIIRQAGGIDRISYGHVTRVCHCAGCVRQRLFERVCRVVGRLAHCVTGACALGLRHR